MGTGLERPGPPLPLRMSPLWGISLIFRTEGPLAAHGKTGWRGGQGAALRILNYNLKKIVNLFFHTIRPNLFFHHTHTTRIRHPSPFRSCQQRSRQFKSLDNKKPLGAKTSALIDARAAWERVTRLKWPIWRKQPSQLR